ncbi:hypothetical protein ACFYMW_31595 [Streptomyces sp. NPDC006692]|uniref:hypothetical protein n=1 Tax=unclassified Streptomyces TaxID=2593676 RepID=UPI0036BD7F15
MKFPLVTEPTPLTALEIKAMRALHLAQQDLHHEYESALAMTSRTYRMEDNAQICNQSRALTHHPDAQHQLSHLTGHYERGVGLLAWCYAAGMLPISSPSWPRSSSWSWNRQGRSTPC